MKASLIACIVCLVPVSAVAEAPQIADMGSVSAEEGLQAWQHIQDVVLHPRCSNCHVGEDNIPMWSGPSYGKTRAHEMDINAGDSRIGAEAIMCSTCHVTSDLPNTVPHAAPHAGIDWQLAPVEMAWFGKTGVEVCAQLKDPDRNGGRDAQGLVDHIAHDIDKNGTVLWGWQPGGGREPAPGTIEDYIKALASWGAAGQPCPTN